MRASKSDKKAKFFARMAKEQGVTQAACIQNALSKFLYQRVLLTREAGAVVDRLGRDHGLTMESIMAVALHRTMEQLEEDVACDGGNSGGECERLLVTDAKAIMAEETLSWRLAADHPQHEIGSKSHADVIKASRRREAARKRSERTSNRSESTSPPAPA